MGRTKNKALVEQEQAYLFPEGANRFRDDANQIRFRIPPELDAVLVEYQRAYRQKMGVKVSKATIIEFALTIAKDRLLAEAKALSAPEPEPEYTNKTAELEDRISDTMDQRTSFDRF